MRDTRKACHNHAQRHATGQMDPQGAGMNGLEAGYQGSSLTQRPRGRPCVFQTFIYVLARVVPNLFSERYRSYRYSIAV